VLQGVIYLVQVLEMMIFSFTNMLLLMERFYGQEWRELGTMTMGFYNSSSLAIIQFFI